jgi:hypothetical protein
MIRRICNAKADRSEKAIASVLLIYLLYLFVTTSFYTVFCFKFCGMIGTTCLSAEISVVIEDCHNNGHPETFSYTGHIKWIVIQPALKRNFTFFIDEGVSCSTSEIGAYDTASRRYPIGTVRKCWYRLDGSTQTNRTLIHQFDSILDVNTWLRLNIVSSIVGLGFVIIGVGIVVSKRYRNALMHQDSSDAVQTSV